MRVSTISAYPAKRRWVYMNCYHCGSPYTELYLSLGQFNYNGFKCHNCNKVIDF